MGQASPLKLGQRGQDARAEVPRRTPKRFYAHERIIINLHSSPVPMAATCG
jgi:hypothetical protein